MRNFATKYIVAVVIVAILMIVYSDSSLITSFNNVLGVIGLLAGIEAMSKILK